MSPNVIMLNWNIFGDFSWQNHVVYHMSWHITDKFREVALLSMPVLIKLVVLLAPLTMAAFNKVGLRNRARGGGLGLPRSKVATVGRGLDCPGWQPSSGPWVVSSCLWASFRDGLNQSSTQISCLCYNVFKSIARFQEMTQQCRC